MPVPRALSDELLHGLHVTIRQTRCHRFDRLALTIQQQPAHIDGAPMPSLATTNRFQQIDQKSIQTFMALSDLTVGHTRGYHGSKPVSILNVVILAFWWTPTKTSSIATAVAALAM